MQFFILSSPRNMDINLSPFQLFSTRYLKHSTEFFLYILYYYTCFFYVDCTNPNCFTLWLHKSDDYYFLPCKERKDTMWVMISAGKSKMLLCVPCDSEAGLLDSSTSLSSWSISPFPFLSTSSHQNSRVNTR